MWTRRRALTIMQFGMMFHLGITVLIIPLCLSLLGILGWTAILSTSCFIGGSLVLLFFMIDDYRGCSQIKTSVVKYNFKDRCCISGCLTMIMFYGIIFLAIPFSSVFSTLQTEDLMAIQFDLFWIFALLIASAIPINIYNHGRNRYVSEFAERIVERRRLGRRSDIKRDDVRRIAKGRNTMRLIMILSKDPNFRNRMLAAEALGEMKDPLAIEALVTSLTDVAFEVRLTCALALLNQANYSGKAIIVESYKKGLPEDRIMILKALSDIDEDWTLNLVELGLSDVNDEVRRIAEDIMGS